MSIVINNKTGNIDLTSLNGVTPGAKGLALFAAEDEEEARDEISVYSTANVLKLFSRTRTIAWISLATTGTTGAGSSAGGASHGQILTLNSGTDSGGAAVVSMNDGIYQFQAGTVNTIDTAKPFLWSFNMARNNAGSANAKCRVGWGKAAATAVGDWATNGFGWSIVNGTVYGWYYDGSLTETTTNFTISTGVSYTFAIVRTLTAFEFYINGTLYLTLTVAGFSLTTQRWYRIEVVNNGDTTDNQYRISSTTFTDLQ